MGLTVEAANFFVNQKKERGFGLEFRDTNGIYRSYKQRFDGGYVISKEE